MRYYILLSTFLLSAFGSFAQRTFQVKVYQNTDYFNVSYYNLETRETRNSTNLNFSRVSLAFAINTKRNFIHEIEFLIPDLSKSIYKVKLPLGYSFKESNRLESTISTYSFRYELSKILTGQSKRFNFYLGIGVNPYYTKTEYEPTDANIFYSYTRIYGASFNIIPRINFNITDRILLDVNIPVKIYDIRNTENHINNPALPIRQQTANEFSDVFFEDAYTIRLGVSYVFR